MDIKVVRDFLAERLVHNLPGWEAQYKMSTYVHQNARLKPSKNSRKAAVLMLLFADQNQLCLPLIERPVYDGVHSGQMAFPGGKYELEDNDLSETALRETHEEIGVAVDKSNLIGRLTDLYIPPSNITVSPFVAVIDEKPKYLPDPLEVANITEVSINQLQAPENHTIKEIKVFNGSFIKAPSFIIQGKTIWGATAMMLSELLFLLKELD